MGYENLKEVNAEYGEDWNQVLERLPKQLTLKLSNGETRDVDVTWPSYLNTYRPGEVKIYGRYDLPEDVKGDKPEVSLTIIVAEKPAEPEIITAVGYKAIDSVTVKYGESRAGILEALPNTITLLLSNEKSVDVTVEDWMTSKVNTWAAGTYYAEAQYELPENVTGDKPEVKAEVIVEEKKTPDMALDQQDYYYDENPVITLKNMNFPEKVTVTYLGDYSDKEYTDGVEYRYDKENGTITLFTQRILKRDSGSLSSAERVDLEVNAGDHLKYITVSYKASKSVYAYPTEYEDIETGATVKAEVIGLEKADYDALKLYAGDQELTGIEVTKESVDGEPCTYINIPYAAVKDHLEENGSVALTGKVPGAKAFTLTLSYKQETEAKTLNAEIPETDDGPKYGYPIYPYNEYSSIKININDSELTLDKIKNELQIDMQSEGEKRFTVPSPIDKETDSSKYGYWSVRKTSDGFQVLLPTDQSAGTLKWQIKPGTDNERYVTTIYLKLTGYTETELHVVLMP